MSDAASKHNAALEAAIAAHHRHGTVESITAVYETLIQAQLLIPNAPPSAGGPGGGGLAAATFNDSRGGMLVPAFTSQSTLEGRMGQGWPWFSAGIQAIVDVAQSSGFGVAINPGPGELLFIDEQLGHLADMLSGVGPQQQTMNAARMRIHPADGVEAVGSWLAATLPRWPEVSAAALFGAVMEDEELTMCGVHFDEGVAPERVEDVLSFLATRVWTVAEGRTIDFVRLEGTLLNKVQGMVAPVYLRGHPPAP